jgi:hypothetical protein
MADRIIAQSRVPLEAELARKAGREFAIYMDKEIISQLDASTSTLAFADAGNVMQLSDITAARRILNKNNVDQSDRFLLVAPEKEEDMLNIENFIHADKYGSGNDPLINGEIGRVYGFRVVVSNLLTEDQVFAYNRECVGYAIQKQIRFETDRPSVALQVTDYGYSAGWGFTQMYDSKKCVKFTANP